MSGTGVQQGLWQRHDLSRISQWQLTVTDNEALALMASVAVLVTFAQTRLWVMCRYALCRWAMPKIRLFDPDDPVKSISQGNAIRALKGINNKKAAASTDMRSTPAIFGVVAIANIAFFIFLGVFLPWSLGLSLETPLVLATRPVGCATNQHNIQGNAHIATLADSMYRQCWGNESDDIKNCGTAVSNSRIELWYNETRVCPFGGDICSKDSTTVVLEHKGIKPSDLGVNTRASFSLKHRLTCAPVTSEPFTTFYTSGADLNIANPALDRYYRQSRIFRVQLQSHNGPNNHSQQISGCGSNLDEPVVEILPNPGPRVPDTASQNVWNPSLLHPFLQVDDAQTFLITLKAGDVAYNRRVTGPFFSAKLGEWEDGHCNGYCPDHELSAIACAEQYAICHGSELDDCSAWQPMDRSTSAVEALYNSSISKGQVDFADDVYPLIFRYIWYGSVYGHLGLRGSQPNFLEYVFTRDDDCSWMHLEPAPDQWIRELKAWFGAAVIHARLALHDAATANKVPGATNNFPVAKPGPYYDRDICGRLLVPGGDYTNIGFVPLVSSVVAMVLLCLLSYESFWRMTLRAKYALGHLVSRLEVLIFTLLSFGRSTSASYWLRSALGRSSSLVGKAPNATRGTGLRTPSQGQATNQTGSLGSPCTSDGSSAANVAMEDINV